MTTFLQAPFWAINRGRVPMHPVSVEVTPPALEPLSLNEVKARLRIDGSDSDAELVGLIIAARRQVEKDLSSASLVATTWDHWIDRPPPGASLELPRWPLQSVTSVTSYDDEDATTVMDSGDYLVDTGSRPGRVLLKTGVTWPTGLRPHRAIAVRYVAGFSGAVKSVTSITRSGTTATVTTEAAHGYATGMRVTLAGADQAAYNGTFEVTTTGAATFTCQVTSSPATPATGVMTVAHLGIPETYTLAMLLLLAHWDTNREAVLTGTISKPIELAYESLLSDAPVSLI